MFPKHYLFWTNNHITGAVAKAIKSHPDLHFGVYFCQQEWYHPLYLQDKSNKFTTQYFVKVASYTIVAFISPGTWDRCEVNSLHFVTLVKYFQT